MDGAGEFWSKATRHRLLTQSEERELLRRVKSGGPESAAALEKLVMHNLRLVAKIAMKLQHRGVELEDLFSVGVDGLLHAIGKFELDRNIKLSTYASPWIFQRCQRAVEQHSDTIRLPGEIKKIRLTAANSPELGVRELAAKTKTTVKKVLYAHEAGYVGGSLHERGPDGGDGEWWQNIEDENSDDPAAPYDSETQWIWGVVAQLPNHERRVIELAFGLDDGVTRSDAEIADAMNISCTEAGVIRRRALQSLRAAVA